MSVEQEQEQTPCDKLCDDLQGNELCNATAHM
jgi:hypothetical protein